jgi:excisionase family DNA binding protein
MPSVAEWLTLNEVAAQLGVAPRTARRWIREGKIHAELRRGPRGLQYFVPDQQIETAAALQRAVQADPATSVAAPGPALQGYMSDRDGNVISLLEDLRARLAEATAQQVSLEARLRDEMRVLHEQIAAGIEALRQAHVAEIGAPNAPPAPRRRRWWWPFR